MAWSADALPEPTSALAPFVEAGVFDAYEVNLVATVARLQPGLDHDVALALALAARAPRSGHVCTGLDTETVERVAGADDLSAAPLPWPDPESWERSVRDSPLVGDAHSGDRVPRPPLVWDLGRIYLQRLWKDELEVAGELWRRSHEDAGDPRAAGARSGAGAGGTLQGGADGVEQVLDLLFGPSGEGMGASGGAQPDRQRRAAARALRHPVSVIAGGPGTGKTHTVARILAAAHLLAGDGSRLSVAMAAPTGKAASRMSEAVAGAVGDLAGAGIIGEELAARLLSNQAITLHRLLGARGDASYAYDRRRPLPHDLVIVDETSMVSLPMLARLVAALRPDARLVLVGDPSQLTSIEAGTVMSDVVGPEGHADADAHPGQLAGKSAPLAGRVTVLERVHRY
ncbi:MAG TPA: AAA family ATPase, partial [Acidimicrobiales bacterium]|nr:AAA family ATPase [Acidimicrobiales bacterium]